jgi:hypothetical protein
MTAFDQPDEIMDQMALDLEMVFRPAHEPKLYGSCARGQPLR